MSSGAIKKATGSFIGTGAQLDVKTVGFRPKHVVLLNKTGLARLEWTDTMADAAGIKTVTDGTISAISTGGITPLASGFRLGADTDINVSAEEVHFIATE